ncbi:MAG TPA: GTP cyclohydrolase I [Terriglobales bacterium]|nr:GTP cyclohydrolase I [Terriglobales bacterium]
MRTIVERQSLARSNLKNLIREVLLRLGEDPERDGLRDTPARMERSMQYLTKGYQENLEGILLGAMFDVAYDELVIVSRTLRCLVCANTTFCRSSARSTSFIFRTEFLALIPPPPSAF